MRQRPVAVADKRFHVTVAAYRCRHALQPIPLAQCILKELWVGLVAQQRHRYAVGLPQRRLQNILLHPVEVGKAVHIDVLSHQIVRARQGVAKLLHPGAGIYPLSVEARIVSTVDQRRRAQLFPCRAVHIGYLLHQCRRRHPVGVQLIRQRHQLPQKRRPLGGTGKYRQPSADLLQRPPHGQQLAASVQRHVRQSAGLGQYTGGQISEAQHLRIAAGCGSQRTAQIQLRLVGGVLRYQQDLRPLPPLLHCLQHPAALARTGAAHPDLQFHPASLVSRDLLVTPPWHLRCGCLRCLYADYTVSAVQRKGHSSVPRKKARP